MKQFLFLLIALIQFTSSRAQAQEKRFSFTREKMASPFSIIFFHSDSSASNLIANQCFKLADSFINIYSDYIESSELNQLSLSSGSGRFVPVSPALIDIIKESEKAYILTKGAFDITMGPVIRLWRKARKEKQFPEASAIAAKMKSVGFDKVKIDTVTNSIKLTAKDMQLDLGGIAQGYIAQKVLERLYSNNIRKALINVSGDIAAGEAPPLKRGWTIGVNLPESEELQINKLVLSNRSVSTSGDMYQFIEHEGKKFSHIIDPKSGYGITSMKNVTVIANDATTADWLATACSIMPIKKAKRLAKKLRAEVLIAELKNGVIVQSSTKKFSYFYNLNTGN
ncbi:MAG: FAD:protein transferase [Segetibacter sp.]|nr:FAD:protein transferase [Segetibacter sp.]